MVPSENIRANHMLRVIRILVFAAVISFVPGYGVRAFAGAQMPFPRPPVIEQNVEFWVNVFATYTERDFVIHDRDQVWRIYQVLHLPGEGAPGQADAEAITDYLKNKYANILNRLATGQKPADYEERQVAAMFKGEPLSAYAVAAQNLRVQEGMREQFRDGLVRSRYYRPTMERIFREAGLPPELVTLAEVESGFYSRAKSGAGAVGIWQFTRATGKQFMRITSRHDDRLDPTAETAAAAKLLRSNYLTLRSWPLAITAYNYGTSGMMHASEAYDGDYSRIVRNYNGPHFGFASKNYYPEFLAALQVHQYENTYFPDIEYAQTPTPPPVRTEIASRRGTRHRRIASIHHASMHHRHHGLHHRRAVAAAGTSRHGRAHAHRAAVAESSAPGRDDS